MIQFLLEYKHELLQLVIGIIVILVTILKKKVRIVDSVYQFILGVLPTCINHVEQSGYVGAQKKRDMCKEFVILMLKNQFPDIDVDIYDKFIVENIENILSTPQKKEVSNGER